MFTNILGTAEDCHDLLVHHCPTVRAPTIGRNEILKQWNGTVGTNKYVRPKYRILIYSNHRKKGEGSPPPTLFRKVGANRGKKYEKMSIFYRNWSKFPKKVEKILFYSSTKNIFVV